MGGGCVIRAGRCSVARCSPPGCRLLSALSWWRRRKNRRDKTAVNSDDDPEFDHNPIMQARCSMNGFNGGDLLNSTQGENGMSRQQTPVNAEVGCCMLYLLAVSRNELDKMIELRTQMEMLLRSAKQELVSGDDTVPKLSEPKDVVVALSSVDGTGCPDDSSSFSSPYKLAASKSSATSMASADNLKSRAPKPDESSEGMDQLEAEFEAEFEHLQIHHDRDLKYLDQNIKAKVTDTVSSESYNASFGVIIDNEQEEAYIEEQFDGVSPYELESRLHELLESRQSEQIEELEDALQCISRKLEEKEMEISWWKDTAHLVMQNIPEPLRRDLNTKHIIQ